MKQTVFALILTAIMTVILAVLGLFDLPYADIILSGVSVLLFAGASMLLKSLSPKTDFKTYFSFKPVRFRHIGVFFGCLLMLTFGGFLLNTLTNFLCGLFGVTPEGNYITLTDSNYAVTIITVALIPAVFEELFFRGAMRSFFNNKSPIYVTLVTAALFTVMHGLDPYFITTFFAGIILCLSVYLTGSLYIAMIIHFVNNIFGYFISYYASMLSEVQLTSVSLYFAGLVLLLSGYLTVCSVIHKTKRKLKHSEKTAVKE